MTGFFLNRFKLMPAVTVRVYALIAQYKCFSWTLFCHRLKKIRKGKIKNCSNLIIGKGFPNIRKGCTNFVR